MEAELIGTRHRRLRIRAWRRGMKETDLILGRFADAALEALTPPDLDRFEALLAENDQDILAWITGAATPPEPLAALVGRIASHARRAVDPGGTGAA